MSLDFAGLTFLRSPGNQLLKNIIQKRGPIFMKKVKAKK